MLRLLRVAVLCVGVSGCLGATSPRGPLPPGGHHVLFVGNSLTYYNNLPRTLADLAWSTGDTIRARMVAKPDYGIEDHLYENEVPDAIASGGWEYIILQQGPSSLEESRTNLIAWTKVADSLARRVSAKVALYMVWPADVNRSSFPRVGGSYYFAAQAVGGMFIPAGYAWLAAWEVEPSVPLYGPDGFHPSALGTYLAAAVMYERITGKDARLLPKRIVVDGVDQHVTEALADLLHSAAHRANTEFPAYPLATDARIVR